ncbi:hypothetical protein A2U01_0072355, partial [Trifolium medium]|nr:hypothetical protein [Trifolium medium]
MTTSEKKKEDPTGKEKTVQKKVVVAVEGKKDKKRKSSGINIDEGRSKLKHDKRSKIDESSTESDEETLGQ